MSILSIVDSEHKSTVERIINWGNNWIYLRIGSDERFGYKIGASNKAGSYIGYKIETWNGFLKYTELLWS